MCGPHKKKLKMERRPKKVAGPCSRSCNKKHLCVKCGEKHAGECATETPVKCALCRHR